MGWAGYGGLEWRGNRGLVLQLGTILRWVGMGEEEEEEEEEEFT